VDYQGPFTNPLRISSESGLLFKDNMVFQTDGKTIKKDCKEAGKDCSSELYPSEAPQASEPSNLISALADKNAITCRYNESEDMCGSQLDGEGIESVSPKSFSAKAGYTTIIKQETFDDPGTQGVYLKMTVKN
jgi:hypothetical protein